MRSLLEERGKVSEDKQGYVRVWCKNHPLLKHTSGWVAQSRLIMEDHLGRYITEDEVVHHINGIRNDNRIENLKVMTVHDHLSLHRLEKNAERRKKILAKVCAECGKDKPYYNKRDNFITWNTDPRDRSKALCRTCYTRICYQMNPEKYRERKRLQRKRTAQLGQSR